MYQRGVELACKWWSTSGQTNNADSSLLTSTVHFVILPLPIVLVAIFPRVRACTSTPVSTLEMLYTLHHCHALSAHSLIHLPKLSTCPSEATQGCSYTPSFSHSLHTSSALTPCPAAFHMTGTTHSISPLPRKRCTREA